MRPHVATRFFRFFAAVALCCAALVAPAQSADIHVATASNFLATLTKLAADFESRHPEHQLRISSGSSGKLYAQIVHGAPYDVFLSADRERPALLHQQGLADAPVTYAIGRLVLYAPDGDPRARLERDDFDHLAIANPQTAPYGAAARTVLESMHRWDALQARLVVGENIGQTFQFVHSGNAALGFVALAQVRAAGAGNEQYWEIPAAGYPALDQQAVVLRRSDVPDAATRFVRYLQTPPARTIILDDGYDVIH